MEINCIIIDDEKPARDGLARYLARVEFLHLVGVAKSVKEASQFLDTHNVDLIFVDIQMPKVSGVDFLKSLENPPLAIFTTAYREYAVEGFELNAVDYLVKPISFDRFQKACQKALEVISVRTRESDYLFIKETNEYIRINIKEIIHLQAAGDYVFIYMASEKRHMVLMPLKQVVEQLPSNSFVQTHRSHVINKSFVTGLEGSNVMLQEKMVPISRLKMTEVRSQLISDIKTLGNT